MASASINTNASGHIAPGNTSTQNSLDKQLLDWLVVNGIDMNLPPNYLNSYREGTKLQHVS